MRPTCLLVNHRSALQIDPFSWGGRVQPLNLAYLAAYLRAHQFPVEILDADVLDHIPNQVVAIIKKDKPEVVGLSAVTANFHEVVKLARRIKKIKNPPLVIIGGAHVTAIPQEIKKYPFFDFAVLGEGEETLLELMEKITSGLNNFEKIKGIAFIKKGKLTITSPRPYIENLDKLPFPAYDLLPPISAYHPSPGMYRNLPMTMMITSRGCPYQCIFCYRAIFGNAYRVRSAENVVDEVEVLVKKFGIKEIRFTDDLFTLDEKRVLAICEEILKRKLKISWSCAARANSITKRMLLACKKAGCWQIAYGIESGNSEVLRLSKKGLTLEAIKKAVRMTWEADIEPRGFFIFGLPGDNEQTMQQTIDFARQLKLSVVNFHILIPYPGTEIAEKASKFGKINRRDFKNYLNQTTASPPFVPYGLTKSKLLKYYQKANREFYLRPSYLISKLLKIRTWPLLRAYPEALLSIIWRFLK